MNEKQVSKELEPDNKKMHDYEDSEHIYYEPFQFVLKNLGPLMQDIELKKRRTDDSVK
jgi:hypothetical protein